MNAPPDPNVDRPSPEGPETDAPEPSPSDAELVDRMARGRIEAARELYRRLSPLVYSLACQITGLQEDAEEVLVDAFQQAWAQAGQYDPARATVTGWILNIARSRGIDQVRARWRWQRQKQKASESIASFPVRPAASPETEAMRTEERTRLQQAIDALPPDQRRVIELAYFGGLSHTQIAEHLGQPLGTVKTRLRMAMKRIRSALSGVEGMER
jgi:RNA polymerase sigma-70 factor (ECF subfamily)